MTSDKVKNAIIAVIAADITTLEVVDAQRFTETELACIAVGITKSEKFNASLAKVESIEIEIKLRAHAGDADEMSRDEVETLTDTLQSILQGSSFVADVNAEMDGVCVDYFQCGGGFPSWDENTLECTFECECYAQRATG